MILPKHISLVKSSFPLPDETVRVRVYAPLGDTVIEVVLPDKTHGFVARDTLKGLKAGPGKRIPAEGVTDLRGYRVAAKYVDAIWVDSVAEYLGRRAPPPPASKLSEGEPLPGQLTLGLGCASPEAWLQVHRFELFRCPHLRASIKAELCAKRQRGECRSDDFCLGGKCQLGKEQLRLLGYLRPKL